MSRIVIEGGNQLSGVVRVGGGKNAALPILAACILSAGPLVLENVPRLNDVDTMGKVINALGVNTERLPNGDWKLHSPGGVQEEAPYELVKAMRASFFVMGPLLARLKKARVPLPGGCAIGVRPVNIHLKGFEALGARVSLEAGCAVAVADRLVGARILLDFPSVGATENLMMAASLAEGTTTIENAACEPEIADLAGFLNAMGGKVTGAGTPTVVIEGVKELGGCRYRVMPDRIDGGTFLVLGAMSPAPITIENISASHQQAVIAKLQEMGAVLEIGENRITACRKGRLKPVEIKTLPFPGFPTDMQAQFMVALCLAEGTSIINETVFENRFMHVAELSRMGAQIAIRDRTVVINGVEKLHGAPVAATDLRAGAALVMAGLNADDRTEVSNVHHIDRGYQDFVPRLMGIGAQIKRLDGNGHS